MMYSRSSCFCRCYFKIADFRRLLSKQAINWTPDLDLAYLCEPSNTGKIRKNIRNRKGVGNIDKVLELNNELKNSSGENEKSLKSQILNAALKIPNICHPDVENIGEEPVVVRTIGEDFVPPPKAAQFHDIANKFNVCRTESLSNYTGPRSYYFIDDLCFLEHALIQYSLSILKKHNFKLISVPDILPRAIIEYCGMDTRGERNQVYSLEDKGSGDLCLSGTAEIGIAYYLSQRLLEEDNLPLKLTAVSRCFRAETAKIAEEKGVYRVHQFTKVEMFGACLPSQSDSLLQEFVQIQEDLFTSLGLKLRTLDMPPGELGAQASRKYDVEAWLGGRAMWGELSSASNCTDYQARRLGIKTSGGYVHTINGTACAAPRLILALLETHQTESGAVELPSVLHPYLSSLKIKESRAPKLTPFKTRARFS